MLFGFLHFNALNRGLSALAVEVCKVHRFRNYCAVKMSKTAVVLLAPGSEEMEFVIAADVLRRGGIKVTIAGLRDSDPVKCSRNVVICPDTSLSEAIAKGPYDVIVLPGGLAGSKAFAESSELGTFLKEQETTKRIIAAICAAPTALKAHCIGLGKELTSYPTTSDVMSEGGVYSYQTRPVVVDGELITSRGPGTAFQFALTLVEKLTSKENAQEVAKGMLLEY